MENNDRTYLDERPTAKERKFSFAIMAIVCVGLACVLVFARYDPKANIGLEPVKGEVAEALGPYAGYVYRDRVSGVVFFGEPIVTPDGTIDGISLSMRYEPGAEHPLTYERLLELHKSGYKLVYLTRSATFEP